MDDLAEPTERDRELFAAELSKQEHPGTRALGEMVANGTDNSYAGWAALRAIAAARAEERELCAKIADDYARFHRDGWYAAAVWIAAKIRSGK